MSILSLLGAVGLQKSMMSSLKTLPILKKGEEVLHKIGIAIGFFIALCVMLFLCILITTTYVIILIVEKVL